MSSNSITHEGGCHCGRVRYQVQAPADLTVYECNCSICSKSGYLHLPVDKDNFTLLRGEDALASYTFDTQEAKHLFCRHCGIKSYYIPRSNPDGFTVNVRCLEQERIKSMTIIPFDGKNWDEHIDEYRSEVQADRARQQTSKG